MANCCVIIADEVNCSVLQSGLVCRIFAGGDGQAACVVGDGSSLMSAVYQLAASERSFYMNLDKIEQLFIQPLLQLGQNFSHLASYFLLYLVSFSPSYSWWWFGVAVMTLDISAKLLSSPVRMGMGDHL